MLTRNSVWRFAFRLLLLYGLLVAPWPGLKQAYGSFFRACGNKLFHSFGTGLRVDFRPPPVEQPAWDVEAYMSDGRKPGSWHIEYSSRGWGYLPTAAVMALVLATPLTWRRRCVALFWGLVLVNIFVIMRVTISLLFGFHWGGSFQWGEFWGKVLKLLLFAFSDSPVTSFIVPVVIWLIVCYSRDDWEKLIRGKVDSTPEKT